MIVRETVIASPTAANQVGAAIRAHLLVQSLELERLLQDMRKQPVDPKPQG